jgi:general secretion pathway protein A
MYNKFFGFKEKPFKLVPNPEYLFLSKSHEEALAHLSYAINHGDGFVEIIGEVGTGKTTLCRVFLENLDKSLEAAYIFNPKLDALQLLKVINDEFGIDSTPDNTKDLIDRLNNFLIEKKSAGQKALVLIDEAQNLSLEVLEQLRLLSNLETTQEKLLQIILVGQPELGEMLASHQLRQLGQRITINCQLTPLTFQETKDYINHRIALASHRAGPPFDNNSLRAIYEYSRGIPRLINIACDRALLNAFSHNSFKITGAITKEAITELTQQKTKISRRQQVPTYAALSVIVLALIGSALYLYVNGRIINPTISETSTQVASPQTITADKVTPAPTRLETSVITDHGGLNESKQQIPDKMSADVSAETVAGLTVGNAIAEDSDPLSQASSAQPQEPYKQQGLKPALTEPSSANSYSVEDAPEPDAAARQFLHFLIGLNSRHSRHEAILQAVKLWSPVASISPELEAVESDQVFFRKAAEKNELLVQPMATDADLTTIKILNLPAVLTFYLPNHAWPKYLTLAGLDANNVYLDAGDQGGVNAVNKNILLRFWSGEAYIIWKDFLALDHNVKAGSTADSVTALKKLLQDLAYSVDGNSSDYDPETRQSIKNIQRQNGLEVDGIVGPFTKIVLYNENNDFIKPLLVKTTATDTESGS